MYVPYLKQEEPLKVECQHFLDCIHNGKTPLTNGRRGLEVVKILEAASASLKQNGAAVEIEERHTSACSANGTKVRTVREPELVCA
jgi:predicted dehydrogenase